jgi:hypothetical protein
MANSKKQPPQFIHLTSAQKGTPFRINTSEISVYTKPEGAEFTSLFMIGDSGPKLQVKETPDEIDRMLGINFMD